MTPSEAHGLRMALHKVKVGSSNRLARVNLYTMAVCAFESMSRSQNDTHCTVAVALRSVISEASPKKSLSESSASSLPH